MSGFLHKFERVIVLTLMGFMMIAVFVATIEVGFIFCEQMIAPPFLLLNVNELLEIFGFVLMVVIGLELLETIKAYLDKRVIHVEVVLLVALVAVARKVIILDYKDYTAEMLFAVAALVVALSAGFFVVRRALDGDRRSTLKDEE